MKLLGSIESKTTEDENGKNMPLFEATEIVLVHCNFVSNNHQKDSRVLYTFAPWSIIRYFNQKFYIFKNF